MPTHPGIDVDQNTDLIYFFIDINAGANNPLDFLCAKNTLQVSEVGLWWIRSDSDCLLHMTLRAAEDRRWSEAGEVCLHANALQLCTTETGTCLEVVTRYGLDQRIPLPIYSS